MMMSMNSTAEMQNALANNVPVCCFVSRTAGKSQKLSAPGTTQKLPATMLGTPLLSRLPANMLGTPFPMHIGFHSKAATIANTGTSKMAPDQQHRVACKYAWHP